MNAASILARPPARAAARTAVAAGVVIGALVVLGRIPTNTVSGEWEMPLPAAVLGAIIGLTYGLLGVGVVLVYRTNRIVNFAHGEIGALGAAVVGYAVVSLHVPYWVAFPVGLTIGALAGGVTEVAVIRRLRKAPRLMSVVATLGVGQVLVVLALLVNSSASAGSVYPRPSFLPTFRIGALLITPAYVGMMLLGPVLVVGLALFLRRSRHGLALRAAAAAPEAARMAGVFATRMSSLAWMLAGALSAFTAILTQPDQGFSGAQTFGPSLLLRALAAAAVARMANLPVTLVAGVALGMVEQLLLWNFSQSGIVQAVLFGIILAALLVQRARGGREDEERQSWAAVQALRPLPDALREVWLVRHLGSVVGLVALIAAGALPLVMSHATAVKLSGIFALSIVGLSLGIVTGLAGQLSLGQFAIAAVGGVVSFHVTAHGGNFVFAFIYAGVVGAAVAFLLGVPALRARGLILTVTTLSFALIAPQWLLDQPWMLGPGVAPSQPRLFGTLLYAGRPYYYLALAMLLLALLIARNVRRSGMGRLMIAVRDNEDNARAFAVRASLTKTHAFLIAGFLAGIGGALYMHGLARVSGQSWPTALSVDLVKMTVIGGLGIMVGPLLGALLVLAVPLFIPLDNFLVLGTTFGQLLIIMYLPGGIAQLVEPLRNRVVSVIARRAGVDAQAAFSSAVPTGEHGVAPLQVRLRDVLDGHHPGFRTPTGVALEARGLLKRYGGVIAVDDTSFRVRTGETVGLIGPNGAGKTTTFELLAGFLRPDGGTVYLEGNDVTGLGPEARARLGLVRSFQDSALFPTMTVTDVVAVALERSSPTSFFPSVSGLSLSERARQQRAREIVGVMGLHPYRDMQIQELSTGTRRITELACLVAARPRVLLFDEPSTGIAQRETEALGQVLREVKAALDLTLVVIEHDMPLIMGLADRIIAMADGRVIAEGSPSEIANDPAVIHAYLGVSSEAIERSGPMARARR